MESAEKKIRETSIDAVAHAERSSALRVLLRQPLIFAKRDSDAFRLVARHRLWLVEWFGANTGWRLRVDLRAGIARLFKIPGKNTSSHPAIVPGKLPFDRRRYALLCLVLSVLEEGISQTTLQTLAEQLEIASQGNVEINLFDPTLTLERRAFVDILKWLLEHTVLVLRDGDAERYIQSRDGDALFDINHTLLTQLLACSLPPALAGTPTKLTHETYPETDEGRRSRARHSVTRRLLDEPVVYYNDLELDQVEWLDHSRAFIYRLLESDVGLQVERRKEGLLTADPAGELTDVLFPEGGSTVRHAALLLAERLAELGRQTHSDQKGALEQPMQLPRFEIAKAQIILWTEELMGRYGKRCSWSQEYTSQPDGVERLTDKAIEILRDFRLIELSTNGWRPLPAIARFAAQEPGEPRSSEAEQEEMLL